MAKKKVSKKKGIDNKNLVVGVVVILLLIGVFWYFNNQGVYFQPGMEDEDGDDGIIVYIRDTDYNQDKIGQLKTASCVQFYEDDNCMIGLELNCDINYDEGTLHHRICNTFADECLDDQRIGEWNSLILRGDDPENGCILFSMFNRRTEYDCNDECEFGGQCETVNLNIETLCPTIKTSEKPVNSGKCVCNPDSRRYFKDTDTVIGNPGNINTELNTASCVMVYTDSKCTIPLDDPFYEIGEKCVFNAGRDNPLTAEYTKKQISEYYSKWVEDPDESSGPRYQLGIQDSIEGCSPHPMRRVVKNCPPCPDNQEPLCVTIEIEEVTCPGITIPISAAKCTCVESEVSGESPDCIKKRGTCQFGSDPMGTGIPCCENLNCVRSGRIGQFKCLPA